MNIDSDLQYETPLNSRSDSSLTHGVFAVSADKIIIGLPDGSAGTPSGRGVQWVKASPLDWDVVGNPSYKPTAAPEGLNTYEVVCGRNPSCPVYRAINVENVTDPLIYQQREKEGDQPICGRMGVFFADSRSIARAWVTGYPMEEKENKVQYISMDGDGWGLVAKGQEYNGCKP